VAARRSYIDTLLPAVLPSNETVAAPVYWDYQARVQRELAPGESLSLFAFGSSDSLEVVSTHPKRASWTWARASCSTGLLATWSRSLGGWTSRLSPSYGYDSVRFRAGEVAARGGAHVLGLREDLTRPLHRGLTVAVGLDAELRFDGIDFNVRCRPSAAPTARTKRPIVNVSRTLTNMGTAATPRPCATSPRACASSLASASTGFTTAPPTRPRPIRGW
jgi:hypothetical protein